MIIDNTEDNSQGLTDSGFTVSYYPPIILNPKRYPLLTLLTNWLKDIQSYWQTGIQSDWQRYRGTDRHTEWLTDRHTECLTDVPTDWHT